MDKCSIVAIVCGSYSNCFFCELHNLYKTVKTKGDFHEKVILSYHPTRIAFVIE